MVVGGGNAEDGDGEHDWPGGLLCSNDGSRRNMTGSISTPETLMASTVRNNNNNTPTIPIVNVDGDEDDDIQDNWEEDVEEEEAMKLDEGWTKNVMEHHRTFPILFF